MLLSSWVTEKWEFVWQASSQGSVWLSVRRAVKYACIRGGKQDYGTALGTLSLVRQMGMTLAPALYAGYITAGYEISAHISNIS
ncbi:hypothetical protein PO124_11945 [Bacillus licheniformis]|nr:hypothetical protein [Bacillus licheniformis]